MLAGTVPDGESLAAHSIVRLHTAGLLDRIRQCVCERWFFARFRNQKSCSAVCRHTAYEKSDDFKRKRREYMRRYYLLKQSRKVK